MLRTGSELLLQALKVHGVETIVALVGDHILPICDLLPDFKLRLLDVRHEAAGIHIADGMCRATGQPTVMMTTGGPGFANSLPGLAVANAAGSPVIHISGRTELATESMGGMQEIDQLTLATPLTKLARLVREPRRIPTTVAEAFRVAMSDRSGPVHITIPFDVLVAQVDEAEAPIVAPPVAVPALTDHEATERAIAILRAAQRPVAIAGGALRYSLRPNTLRQFIEVTGVPLFTTEQARGVVSDRHRLCFGYPDPGLNSAGNLIGRADVILLLGKKQDFRINFCREPFVALRATIIQADPQLVEIGRHREVAVRLVGDVGAVVDQLTTAAQNFVWPDWSPWWDELKESRRSHREKLEQAATSLPLGSIHPVAIYRVAEKVLPANATLLFDVGDFGLWGRAYMMAEWMGGWYWPGPLGHLGTMLPMAIGAKAARPSNPVVCFLGDGALGFHLIELDTAVRHRLPIVVVVGNDAAWGIDRTYQRAYYGRLVGTELRPIRYDRLMIEMGGHGEYVERVEDLPAAFVRSLVSDRPAVVNVKMEGVPSPSAVLKIKETQANTGTSTALRSVR